MSIVLSHQTRRVPVYKPKPNPAPPVAGEPGILADLLAAALSRCSPASAAVLGVAAPGLNLHLLHRDDLGAGYASKFKMKLGHADLTGQIVAVESVELVHAALVLEQAPKVIPCLENLISLVATNGSLSVVLEAANELGPIVSRGYAPQTRTLKPRSGMISPFWLVDKLASYGFKITHHRQRTGPSGRVFWMGIFAAPAAH